MNRSSIPDKAQQQANFPASFPELFLTFGTFLWLHIITSLTLFFINFSNQINGRRFIYLWITKQQLDGLLFSAEMQSQRRGTILSFMWWKIHVKDIQYNHISSFNISYSSLLKHRFYLLNSNYYLISIRAIQSFSDMESINSLSWSVIDRLKKVGMNISMKISLTDMICCFYSISAILSSMSSIFLSCKNKFTYLG